jgi:hypothetical protein
VKNEKEEPKEYFERSIVLVIFISAAALALDWLSIKLLMDVNPWGTATAIPGLMLTLQALWFIVHPYAIVYDNRFEIKQSLIYNKQFYYLDARAVDQSKPQAIQLVYNDGDLEHIPLQGMRASHRPMFKQALQTKIDASLKHRDF